MSNLNIYCTMPPRWRLNLPPLPSCPPSPQCYSSPGREITDRCEIFSIVDVSCGAVNKQQQPNTWEALPDLPRGNCCNSPPRVIHHHPLGVALAQPGLRHARVQEPGAAVMIQLNEMLKKVAIFFFSFKKRRRRRRSRFFVAEAVWIRGRGSCQSEPLKAF